MNRIDARFRALKRAGKRAFVAYITAGDPDLGTTAKLVLALESAGVDMVELGIPFSDPLADGPVIQAASQRALENGATLRKIFAMARKLRPATRLPIAFMTYYNPVLKYGQEKFINACAACGIDGVIIPDLPFEEAGSLAASARKSGIAVIFLAAPTSTRERLRRIVKLSTGFIYYVSLTGVTGARKTLPPEIAGKVSMIKSMTALPVCVGFGVSTAAQARRLAKISDGVIVGSAIVRIIERNQRNAKRAISEAQRFAASLAKAVHGV